VVKVCINLLVIYLSLEMREMRGDQGDWAARCGWGEEETALRDIGD